MCMNAQQIVVSFLLHLLKSPKESAERVGRWQRHQELEEKPGGGGANTRNFSLRFGGTEMAQSCQA